jgi:hypothetical protein
MTYELWDQASGNRIDGFEGPQARARLAQIVREIAELQGLDALDDLFVEVWPTPDAAQPGEILRGDLLRLLIQPLVMTYALELDSPAPAPTTSTSQSTLELAVAV